MGSVRTALAVLETVGEHQPVGVSDVARSLGIPKTTAHRMLGELGRLGWIRSDDAGDSPRWRLTSRVLTLAGQVAQGSDLLQRALAPMQQLNARTGELIHLTIPDGGDVVLLSKIDSTKSVRAWSAVGGRRAMHATSSGKAMLACMDDAEVRALLAAPLERYTDRTLPSVDALLTELALIRTNGYAVNRGEWSSDVASVGAAITDGTGRAEAALSISLPAHRFADGQWQEYGQLVRAACSAARVGSLPSV